MHAHQEHCAQCAGTQAGTRAFAWPHRSWPDPPSGKAPVVPPAPGAFPARRAALAEIPRGARSVVARAERAGWSVVPVLSRGWHVNAKGARTGPATALSLRMWCWPDLRAVAAWINRDAVATGWGADVAYRWRVGCCLPARTPLADVTETEYSHDHPDPVAVLDAALVAAAARPARGNAVRAPARPGRWLGSGRPVDGVLDVVGRTGVEITRWKYVEIGDVVDAGGSGWRVVGILASGDVTLEPLAPGVQPRTGRPNPDAPVRRSLLHREDGPAIALLQQAGFDVIRSHP